MPREGSGRPPLAAAAKRLLDIGASATALVALSPVIGVTAAVVRARMGGPVVFAQRRPGRHEQPFTVYKFRTMTDERDADGNLLPDHVRLTALGRFLRKTSLDELPQLWNVLRGDMSLVGPRPLTMNYLPYYSPRERKRFQVPPGITGLAQVHGRNTVAWDERLGLDADYVEQFSLWNDLRILFETVKLVLVGRGVVEDPRSIMQDLDVERQAWVADG